MFIFSLARKRTSSPQSALSSIFAKNAKIYAHCLASPFPKKSRALRRTFREPCMAQRGGKSKTSSRFRKNPYGISDSSTLPRLTISRLWTIHRIVHNGVTPLTSPFQAAYAAVPLRKSETISKMIWKSYLLSYKGQSFARRDFKRF